MSVSDVINNVYDKQLPAGFDRGTRFYDSYLFIYQPIPRNRHRNHHSTLCGVLYCNITLMFYIVFVFTM